jgi:phage shock protein PspC (stress-responsive transcriptional regulator)
MNTDTTETPTAPTPPPAPTPKRLTRDTDDKMLGGVCSGVADYLGVDVTLVRLLAVVGAILGVGSLVVAYVLAWILIPER